MDETVKRRVIGLVGLLYAEDYLSPCPSSSPWQSFDPSCSKSPSHCICLGTACLIGSTGDSLVAASRVLSHIRAAKAHNAASGQNQLGLPFGSPARSSCEPRFWIEYPHHNQTIEEEATLRYEVKIADLRIRAAFCIMRPAPSLILGSGYFHPWKSFRTHQIGIQARSILNLAEGDTVYSFRACWPDGDGDGSFVKVGAGTVALQPDHEGYGVIVSFDSCSDNGNLGAVVTDASGDFIGWQNGDICVIESIESDQTNIISQISEARRKTSNRDMKGAIVIKDDVDGADSAECTQIASQSLVMAISKRQAEINRSFQQYVVEPSKVKVIGRVEEMFASTGARRKQCSRMTHVISLIEIRHDVGLLERRIEQSQRAYCNVMEISDDDDDDDDGDDDDDVREINVFAGYQRPSTGYYHNARLSYGLTRSRRRLKPRGDGF